MFDNMYCYTKYMAYTTYMLTNLNMCIKNIRILVNSIKHMYTLCHWTTYMWSFGNIFMNAPPYTTPFVALSADQSVV